MAFTPWADIAAVLALTGRTVDALTLSMAKNVIEIKSGAIESVERIDTSQRDLYWLRLATCYQAAWMVSQPDFLERMATLSASQEGQSVSVESVEDWELAPTAKSALKRLSWKGTRTLRPSDRAASTWGVSPLISDEHQDWRPL